MTHDFSKDPLTIDVTQSDFLADVQNYIEQRKCKYKATQIQITYPVLFEDS